jgi:predicted Rossmann-fold nucleotide-binding protein
VVFNVEGYWDGLLAWVKGAVDAGFVGLGPSKIIKEAKEAEEVISLLKGYTTAEGRFKLSWGNE